MGNIFTAISNVYNEPEPEPMILDTEEVSPGAVREKITKETLI